MSLTSMDVFNLRRAGVIIGFHELHVPHDDVIKGIYVGHGSFFVKGKYLPLPRFPM